MLPPPWVPWTRAGCNVGAVSIANMELENISGDIVTVFGPASPEELEVQADTKAKNTAPAIADFEGIAIHCAAGNSLCSSTNNGKPDVLPEEPAGYSGFNALYGHKYVALQISPSGPLLDLDGNPVRDGKGNPGFPGFGGISAAQTLSYVAAMQEHGVPVTYAYISDAHDNHSTVVSTENPFGPAVCKEPSEQGDGFGDAGLGSGDPCYVAQLAAYNEAFGKFFARLSADGINQNNTLFVITADEGDHQAAGPPTPANCDGVNIFCTYSKLGEIDSNLQDLLAKQDPNTANTRFDIQFDMVPVFYIDGNPAVGSQLAREFERDAAALTVVSPITGNTDQLTAALADPVELKLLHMVTGDPQRTPTFVMFGDPDYFFVLGGPDAVEDPGFVWNHGGIQKEIVTTFLGLVGPGVQNNRIDPDVWSDHTDIRPTMLALTGLKDDYPSDGRVLAEEFFGWALPVGIRDSGAQFTELARAYKQINAPNADLARASLVISTRALASGSPGDDSAYINLENDLSAITTQRDAIASQMADLLRNAEFNNQRIHEKSERQLVQQSQALLRAVEALANAQ
jgi:hypothetical protein